MSRFSWMAPNGSRHRLRLVCLVLLLLATALAFSPALRGPQLFDDPAVLDENPSITTLWPPSVPLHPPAQSPVAGRPIANLSLAVNYAINRALGFDQGADPAGPSRTISYHVVNLLLHLGSGLLLLGILRRALQQLRSAGVGVAVSDGMPLAVTAIWLLHPLQTEAVDYLAQRTELLVSWCYLATLYAAIRAWESRSSRTRLGWYVTATLACLLGMGSKEVMVSAPVMVLLYDRVFHLTRWREWLAPTFRSRRWFHGALFATLGLLAILVARSPRSVSAGFGTGMPWQAYLISQGWAIAHYLQLLFWPVGQSFDYGFKPVGLTRALPGLLLVSGLGVLTLFAWRRSRRWGWAAFCGTWFFLLLAPSSSIVPIATEIAAERRGYLAIAGVLVVLVVGVDALLQRLRLTAVRWAATPALATLLALLTWQRSVLYRNPEAIWRDALHQVPDNPRAMTNLGVALLSQVPPRRVEADALFRQAVQVDSTYATAWYNLAATASTEHREAEEEQDLRRVIAIRTTDRRALQALGRLLLAQGRMSAALPYLSSASRVGADAPSLLELGKVQMAVGQPVAAESTFRRAIAEDSSNVQALGLLGAMLSEAGRSEEAEPYLRRAIRLQPRAAMPLALLSVAHAGMGRDSEAVLEASRAITLADGDAGALFFAGRALLRTGRPDLALPALVQMRQLGFRSPDALNALATAEWRLGQDAQAARLFRSVLAVDPWNTTARAALATMAGRRE